MKGTAQRWVVASVASVAVAMAAQMAAAADVTDADRTFRNYTHETATVGDGQIRLEVRGFTEQDEGNHVRLSVAGLPLREIYPNARVESTDSSMLDLIGSWGFMKNAELGFIVPGLLQSTRFRQGPPDFKSGGPTVNDADIGDFLLYTKFQQPVAKHCSVGGGLELTFPNGPAGKGFGTGEFGASPFVSTRYQYRMIGVGANMGYQIYTGSAHDVFNYGTEIILRASNVWALRTELAGRVFNAAGIRFHELQVLPGIDFDLSNRITVRPTGMVKGTDTAPDWGVGVGIAVTL
jgi:hypothetical protein